MGKKIGRRQLSEQREYEYKIKRLGFVVHGLTTVLSKLCKYGCIALGMWFVYLSIDSLSGQVTDASLFFNLITDLNIGEQLAYLLCFFSTGYGFKQRQLRKEKVSKLSARVNNLETEINPNKKSSKISPLGSSNPTDIY